MALASDLKGFFKNTVSRLSMNNAFNDAAEDVANTFVKHNVAANQAVNDFVNGIQDLSGDDLNATITSFAKTHDLAGADLKATQKNINDYASRVSGIDNVNIFGGKGNSYDYDTAFSNIVNNSYGATQSASGFSNLNTINSLRNKFGGSSIPGSIASNASSFGGAAVDYLTLGDLRNRGSSLSDLMKTGATRYGTIAGGIAGIDVASNLLSGNHGNYDNNY